MANIRFEQSAPGRGELYIDGNKIDKVLSIRPDLFKQGEPATVTIVLLVEKFEFVPAKKSSE